MTLGRPAIADASPWPAAAAGVDPRTVASAESGSLPAPLQVRIRQLLACGLLVLLSARLPGHLLAFATTVARPAGSAAHGVADALAIVALDGFGILCAVYLSHTRLRGVRLLRCYPPQRLIPLSLHFLGLVWGLLTLTLPSGVSGR